MINDDDDGNDDDEIQMHRFVHHRWLSHSVFSPNPTKYYHVLSNGYSILFSQFGTVNTFEIEH